MNNTGCFLHPICSKCGNFLAAKIGTMIVGCSVCEQEFEMVERK